MAVPVAETGDLNRVERWFRAVERSVGREARVPLTEAMRETAKRSVPEIRSRTPAKSGRLKRSTTSTVRTDQGEPVGGFGWRYRKDKADGARYQQIMGAEYGNKRTRAKRTLRRYWDEHQEVVERRFLTLYAEKMDYYFIGLARRLGIKARKG